MAFELVFWIEIMADWVSLGECTGGEGAIGGAEEVLRLHALNMASVAWDSLLVDLMGWSTHPVLCFSRHVTIDNLVLVPWKWLLSIHTKCLELAIVQKNW